MNAKFFTLKHVEDLEAIGYKTLKAHKNVVASHKMYKFSKFALCVCVRSTPCIYRNYKLIYMYTYLTQK